MNEKLRNEIVQRWQAQTPARRIARNPPLLHSKILNKMNKKTNKSLTRPRRPCLATVVDARA